MPTASVNCSYVDFCDDLSHRSCSQHRVDHMVSMDVAANRSGDQGFNFECIPRLWFPTERTASLGECGEPWPRRSDGRELRIPCAAWGQDRGDGYPSVYSATTSPPSGLSLIG